ncbi:TonB-dependent siderophore receptor [Achromobacter sp. 413638]|uniref:TonB-dependent siderophore receptor n=1 Tax=Achromobacter sp. 413638 TaxID=3342385 RepID=UPI00370B597C
MSLPSAPFHPRVLRMKTGVALVMAALAGAALAAAQAHAQTPATAAPRVRANVPAGPLGAALAGFARQAQVLLSFDPALADGLQSPGLQGSHGVQEGFDALLAGTSLQAHRRADGDFELRRAGADAAQLAPVVVLGAGATTEGSGLYTADWMRSANGLVLSQRDTPQSTSVITRQQMDDRAIGSVRDVMENATGMNVQQAESERLTYYSRGFSMDTFQFDGVVKPLNSLYQFGEGNLDPAIYDHVEIIRGATGLMSGTGNPGGSVNFIRKRPTREFQGEAKVSAGSHDTYRGEIDLSTPFNASGSVRGRLVGAKERRGDTMDLYSKKRDVLYGIVEADIGESTTISAGGSVQRSRPRGISWGGLPALDASGKPIDWPKGQAMGAKWSRWDTDSHEYFAQIEHGFSNGWNARLSYTRLENTFDAPLLFTSDVPVTLNGFSKPPLLRKFKGGSDQDVYGGSMDGAFDALGRKHQFNLGFSHSIIKAWNQSWDTSDQAGYPIPDVKDWTGDWPAPRWNILALSQTHRDEQTGIYGTLRLQLADRLHLLAGARWTRWQSSETSGGVAGYTHTYSEVTPYLGATYDLDDTYTAYASYTNIFLPQMVKTRSWDMAGPAYGHNYEAGIKAAYLDGRLNASLAVFQTDQKDVAEYGGFDPVHDDGWYYILEGTRTRGFEAELAGEVTPGWNVFVGYTYRQSKDNEGRKVQTTQPEQLLKASTAYRLPGSWNKLTVGGGVRWQSRTSAQTYYGLQAGDIVQKPYALFDLMAQYDFSDKTRLQLNIRNLADKKYYRSMGFYNSVFYGEGRTAMLTLSQRF